MAARHKVLARIWPTRVERNYVIDPKPMKPTAALRRPAVEAHPYRLDRANVRNRDAPRCAIFRGPLVGVLCAILVGCLLAVFLPPALFVCVVIRPLGGRVLVGHAHQYIARASPALTFGCRENGRPSSP